MKYVPLPWVGSSIGPTLRVGFGGRLYEAWKGLGADQQLYYSSFDGVNWTPQAQIPGAASNVGASLATFENKLCAAWSTSPQFPEGSGGPWAEQLAYSSSLGSGWAPPVQIPGTYTEVPPSKYVYSIWISGGGPLGGALTISFFPYGTETAGNPLVTFSGGYGGLAFGNLSGGGTAWLNYDVEWLAQQGWNARFEASFVPAAVNVNLWGLHGENIGNTASGGESGVLGIAGGQGFFYLGG